MSRVLIVGDDDQFRKACSTFLHQSGFDVRATSVVVDGLRRLRWSDLVVLNVESMQGGWSVLERFLEAHPGTPVVVIGSLAGVRSRLRGRGLGAADFLAGPIDLCELDARVRAALERAGRPAEIVHGALRVDLDARRVECDGVEVRLTPLEFGLLRSFVLHPGKVFSREALVRAAWGPDYDGSDRTVDVRVSRLRRRLGDDAKGPRFIETLRDVGYRFRVQE